MKTIEFENVKKIINKLSLTNRSRLYNAIFCQIID